jgi:hypothetical protein
MAKIVRFPGRYDIRFKEERKNKKLSMILSAGCFALVALVLIATADAQSPCDGFGFVPGYEPPVETPSSDVPVEPMPPVVNVDVPPAAGEVAPPPFIFGSKEEAARHRYHCREGVAIWGFLIQREEPAFQPVLSLQDIAPENPFICSEGFEIYPDSQLCSDYPDQASIELDYSFCALTNFQYWIKLQEVQNKQPEPPVFNCKRFSGQNIWKAKTERFNAPGAILDSNAYCVPGITQDMGPIQLSVVDAMGQRISAGQFRHCNTANGNRLHYDFPDMRGATGSAILLIEWEERADECFNIPEVSRDQR